MHSTPSSRAVPQHDFERRLVPLPALLYSTCARAASARGSQNVISIAR